MSYVASKSRLKLAARAVLSADAGLLVETVLRDQVIEFLEFNELIKDSQHRFRNGSSCLTNLLICLDKVLHSVNERYPVDVVFLDLAKAFNKVPRERLLKKLKKHGIRGKLLSVIGDWLSNRKQRVCIKGYDSNKS